MKHLLQLILNLFLLVLYIIIALVGLIWYGKLMKLSPYHLCNGEFRNESDYDFPVKDLFKNPNIHDKLKLE